MTNQASQKQTSTPLNFFTNTLKILFSFKYLPLYLFIIFLYGLSEGDGNLIAILATVTFFLISLRLLLLDSILFKMYFFMFYISYSILIAEYLFPQEFSVNYIFAKTFEIYFTLSILFFIFAYINFLMVVYLKFPKSINLQFLRKNQTVYGVILFVLLIILVFGVDRSSVSENYSVRISSFFEYSKILFIFLYIFSDTSFKRNLSTSLLVVYVLQDLILGGRITAFQLMMIAFIFLF